MSKRARLNQAISAVALVATISGCASSPTRVAKVSDYRDKNVEVGLATRAVAALNSNDLPSAVSLAERAVAKTPTDAGFRALLGNTYFASGRFASAEQSFKDSLSLYTEQPQVMLKLALVEIAQGKTAEALEFLSFARNSLNPADYGLALALAGRTSEAIQILRQAAAQPQADARVRQNLALAYALDKDWVNARVVAAQDVGFDKIDQRIDEWMQFASMGKPSLQIAALVGVTPVAVDPGEPVQLALVKSDASVATATAAPVAVPQGQPAPEPVVAFAPPPPPVEVAVPVAAATPSPFITPAAEPAPAIVEGAPTYVPPPVAAQEFPYIEVKHHSKAARNIIASAPVMRVPFAHPVVRSGKSTSVVQLGAYASANRVMAAWNAAAKRHNGLRKYSPMSARFASAKGPVYRLSVRGFATPAEAGQLCNSIKRGGGSCFVRTFAGDRPMQIASR